MKKLIAALILSMSLSQAFAWGIDVTNSYTKLAEAPHGIDWYLRHGYTLVKPTPLSESSSGSYSVNQVHVLLTNSDSTSLIICRIVADSDATCKIVTDPEYKDGVKIAHKDD